MAAVTIAIRGGEILIDEEDTHFLHGRDWFVQKGDSGLKYAFSKGQSLHRLIMAAGKGQIVDHASGDGLDNRRANLRLCTHTQNMQNRKPTHSGLSTFKGVSLRHEPRPKPYQATIKAFGERIYLGSFETEEGAARAYDRAAIIFHGRFARTNASMGLL